MLSLMSGPGSAPSAGAGHFLPALQDTALTRPNPADSIVHVVPADDLVTPIIQWLFQRSPWVMWGGFVLGVVVLAILLRWAWPRRAAIGQWIASRSRAGKFGLVAAAGVAVLLAGAAGFTSYEFVETDSRFCNGCHIFVPSGQALTPSDTGYYTVVPKLEGKHDTINCHTCHPLNPTKEAVKLLFWMSGVRGKEIPPHAKVPRETCENCHVKGAAKETWQAIAATSGHRTHLESDSSGMKDKKECLTCHARTAHRFPPVNETCGQQGCHAQDKTEIKLAKMASQGEFHCVACHDFVATVPLLATRDSAAGTLRPALQQCFKCHEMEKRLPDFDAAKDPHDGTCGMCHDPHTQKTPADAKATCTSANCHADWRQVKFHVGVQHKRGAENCITCHLPHSARVDASDCTGCHEAVRGRTRFRPPLPFDTLKALRSSLAPESPVEPERPGRLSFDTLNAHRGSLAPEPPPVEPERPSKVKGDAPPGDDSPGRALSALSPQPSDTFSHPQHKKLACLTCHLSRTGARLTFEAPRGCQICHHERPARSDCAKCHEEGSLPETIAVKLSVAAAGKPARERTVAFQHEPHTDLSCTDCHGQAVTLAPVDSAASCQGCHDKHHETKRECSSCHRTAAITTAHERPARAHVACDACHTTAVIAPLSPTRNFCLACHDSVVDHYPEKECATCHLSARPEDYRPRLLKRGRTG